MSSKLRLQQYLLGLDEKSVSRHTPKNRKLEQDMTFIVNKALAKVTEKDNRFQFRLHGSGSFYDGVKVGSPDEFDYIAEITSLPDQSVTFTPTDDPGFVQISLTTQEQRRRWRDCLSDSNELRTSNANREVWPVVAEDSDDSIDLDDFFENDTLKDTHFNSAEPKKEEFISDDMMLAPFKLQKKFKKLFDKAMLNICLPANWEHGGCHRPNYSGCRWHGPATMIMLVYRSQDEEIKINVDVTIGIPVPCPVDFKADLNMNVFEKVRYGSIMEEKLQNAMINGPSIHLIPLYSKMLVKVRHYSNKFSFRISCSLIEKAILNCLLDDSGPKKCFRILKVIRDQYFSEGFRKTHRMKKKSKLQGDCNNPRNPIPVQAREATRPGRARPKKKSMDKTNEGILVESGLESRIGRARSRKRCMQQHEIHSENESDEEIFLNISALKESYEQDNCTCGQTSGNTTELLSARKYLEETTKCVNSMPHKAFVTRETTVQYDCSDIAEKFEKWNIDTESKQKPGKPIERIGWNNYDDTDTTDLTEVDENTTKEEAFKKFRITRYLHQSQDIADMTCEPGSGEYYGPSTYMSSIEIKTYILMLLAKTNWDSTDWSDEKVCDYVEEFLQMYHTLLLEKKMIKNFFFDTMVCSPIIEEQRRKALEMYKVLQKDFNDIMEPKTKISDYASHFVENYLEKYDIF